MPDTILTITLNPTVDYASIAPDVAPDVKLRCSDPEIDPGGGGINVARAIRQLGGAATALVAIGGGRGAQMLQLLTLEGVPTVAFQGPGETRISFSVTEETTGAQYRFVTPGPDWDEGDVRRAVSAIDRAAGDGALVVLSGSQPPGVAKDFPSILAGHVAGRGARLVVDTSGQALAHLVEAPRESVFVLRMDQAEAEELAGRALPRPADTAAFAADLAARGVAANVIVARGADGSVLAGREGRWHARAAPHRVVSKIGAGDSFVGAFTLGLARGDAPEEALRLGVAAAAAACETEATRLCESDRVEALAAVTELAAV